MSQPLPCGGYEWTDPANITLEFIKQYELETCETGYVLEVDLKYPEDLHDGYNVFPLAHEVMCVKAKMLSEYQRYLYSTIYETSPSDSASPELIANLYDNTKYVVHIANLQLYVNMGLILTRNHRGIKFKQSRWSKQY